MPINLSNIKPAIGARKKSKRIGRGDSSGHGTYSTRGIKGQKARSGVSGLKRLGMKKQLLAIPKKRGFNSIYAKNQTVQASDINRHFKDGDLINPKILRQKGLIKDIKKPVKIIGSAIINLKNIKLQKIAVSTKNRQRIMDLGGDIS